MQNVWAHICNDGRHIVLVAQMLHGHDDFVAFLTSSFLLAEQTIIKLYNPAYREIDVLS